MTKGEFDLFRQPVYIDSAMDVYKDRIAALEEKIRRKESEQDELLIEIGREASFAPDPGLQEGEAGPLSPLKETLREIAAVQKTESSLTDTIETINRLKARSEELGEGLKEWERKISRKEKEVSVYYEPVGRAAYQAYRAGELTGPVYDEIFEEIDESQSRLTVIEDELRHSAGEKNSFISRIGKKGRLKSEERRLGKAFSGAGEALLESQELYSELQTETMEAALKPYRQYRQEFQTLSEERRAMEEEQLRLADELKGLRADEGKAGRIRELEGELSQVRHRLTQMYSAAGKMIANGGVDELPAEDDSAAEGTLRRLERLQALKQEAAAAVEEKEGLERERRIAGLQGEEAAMQEKISEHREKIARHQSAVEELERKIAETEDQIRQLKAADS